MEKIQRKYNKLISSGLQLGINSYLAIYTYFIKVIFISCAINLTAFGLLFLFSILLAISNRKDMTRLHLPWIISILIVTFLQFVMDIILLAIMGLTVFTIASLAIWIVSAFLNVYGFLCVLSHYQELKAGRGTARHYPGETGAVSVSKREQPYTSTLQAESTDHHNVYVGKPILDVNIRV
ncbi:uncharacterized protein LOC144361514 [Saccoglossus kowalevskii]